MPKSKANMPSRRALIGLLKPQGKRGPKSRSRRQTPEILLQLPDYGTPERWQHATRRFEIMEVDTQRLAARVIEECMLDVLAVTGKISGSERAAGLKLRHFYMRAKIEMPQSARYDPQPRKEGFCFSGFIRSAGEEEAYDAWRDALLNVGLHDVDVVVTVCCIGTRPAPAQLASLHRGLNDLVRYYKL